MALKKKLSQGRRLPAACGNGVLLRRLRPSEKAASTLTTIVMATTHSVTIAVFLKKIRKSVYVSRRRN